MKIRNFFALALSFLCVTLSGCPDDPFGVEDLKLSPSVISDKHNNFVFYLDLDGDGYGNLLQPVVIDSLPVAEPVSAFAGDCDDFNSAIFLGAQEICDGLDNDCNGIADGTCSLKLNSLPEYDGFHYEYRVSGFSYTNSLKVSGHGYGYGISECSIPALQSGFITFDLSQFQGDWDTASSLDLKVYAVFLQLEPYTEPLPEPAVISVRLWELNNDYSLVSDCDYTSTFLGCGGRSYCSWSNIYTPAGCQLPVFNASDVLFELLPDGDGWYSLPPADVEALRSLLKGQDGEKISFWLDYDAAWYYIADENPVYDPRLGTIILAPPTLSIEYSE